MTPWRLAALVPAAPLAAAVAAAVVAESRQVLVLLFLGLVQVVELLLQWLLLLAAMLTY